MTVSGPENSVRRGRVLVVDDEALLVKLFVRVLSADHDLAGETDPRAAVTRIASGERFDVIFCDLLMPKMSGIALHVEIERIDPEQARRIVFLTGDLSAPHAREFFARVGNLRLQKPIIPSTLRDVVRGMLE
jgi:CheY-like chemotaxis protein